MATLTYWLKTYWYAPLIILIGGFFLAAGEGRIGKSAFVGECEFP